MQLILLQVNDLSNSGTYMCYDTQEHYDTQEQTQSEKTQS